jgi:hypothetical protein
MSSFSPVQVRFAFASGDRQKAHTANAINRIVVILPVEELGTIGDWVTSILKAS